MHPKQPKVTTRRDALRQMGVGFGLAGLAGLLAEAAAGARAESSPWEARLSDRPIAALIQDLKERGLFDETLVLVGSEFGRTPVVHIGGAASVQNGRDHNIFGFTYLLAGGGVKGGHVHGATDDFGFQIVENPVHVHDLHATALHLLGLDHERLTYRYSGRDFRLTDVHGRVVTDIIA